MARPGGGAPGQACEGDLKMQERGAPVAVHPACGVPSPEVGSQAACSCVRRTGHLCVPDLKLSRPRNR